MKKLLLPVLSLITLTVAAQEINLCKQYPTNTSSEKKLPGLFADSLRSDTVDILKTTVNLQVTDFSGKTISGNTKLDFVPRKNGIKTLSLDLLKLIVDSVEINNANLSHSYNDTLLIVTLPATLNIGDTTAVTVYYHGAPVIDATGWGGFYFTPTEAYNLGVGFGAAPHVYGRVWFPCFDNFTERSKFEFNIKTNGGKIAYCNGILTKDSTDANGFRTRTWKLDNSIPSYLACVAVGNYTQVNGTFSSVNGPVPIVLSDIASDTSKLKNSFVHLQNALSCFENNYGPYPWPKVGYMIVPFNSGAMEHATAITYPRPFIQGNTNYEDQLMAHELSHQWWGDHLTCHRAEEMWINEGMATFSQFLFNECVYGKTAYQNKVRANHEDLIHYLHYKEGGYLAIASIPQNITYGDHTYLKGADVAHTMRGYLGDSLFFKGLKYVQANNPFTDLSSQKFRDDMTIATGVNMNDFFKGWVFNGGWPQFSIDSFSSVVNGSTYDVTVHIKQKLDGAPNYFNNVPLEITFKDANWNAVSKTINVSGKTTTATVAILIHPVFAGVDLNEKISDALTSDMRTLSATGNYFNATSNGRMQVSVKTLPPGDSAFIFIEHSWAPPDSFKTPNPAFKLSPYHYWKVSGILPGLFDATATIVYDGRTVTGGGLGYLDHQLLTNTNQEDSIVLMYRKNPGDEWKVFPYFTKTINNLTDKYGTVKIDSLLLGEYAFAFAYTLNGIIENENTMNVSVYPNPFSESAVIILDRIPHEKTTIRLLDVYGRMVLTSPFDSDRVKISRADLSPGVYFYQVRSGQHCPVSGKIIVQ